MYTVTAVTVVLVELYALHVDCGGASFVGAVSHCVGVLQCRPATTNISMFMDEISDVIRHQTDRRRASKQLPV